MNHIRWAAWGVVDIEALERMQRRNYIKRSREQLAAVNIKLECGGSTQTPHYLVSLPTPLVEIKMGHGGAAKTLEKAEGHAAAGKDAFKKVCTWVLQKTEDKENTAHERGEDGGLRSTGAEA
jgi:hypothetical protein